MNNDNFLGMKQIHTDTHLGKLYPVIGFSNLVEDLVPITSLKHCRNKAGFIVGLNDNEPDLFLGYRELDRILEANYQIGDKPEFNGIYWGIRYYGGE